MPKQMDAQGLLRGDATTPLGPLKPGIATLLLSISQRGFFTRQPGGNARLVRGKAGRPHIDGGPRFSQLSIIAASNSANTPIIPLDGYGRSAFASWGERLFFRRSFAICKRVGSVYIRPNRAVVKSKRSSASSFVRVPRCAPSFPSLRIALDSSRRSVGNLPLSKSHFSRSPRSRRVLLLRPGTSPSGNRGRVAKSTHALNIAPAAFQDCKARLVAPPLNTFAISSGTCSGGATVPWSLRLMYPSTLK